MAATADRKSTFFADAAWLDIPFRGRTRGMRQELIDIFVHVPTFLEELFGFDPAKGSPADRHHLSQRIIRLASSIDSLLRAWYLKLGEQTDLSRTHNGVPEDFESENINFALLLTFYWAIKLIVCGKWAMQRASIEAALLDDELPPPTLPDALPIAMTIARSSAYFFSPEVGTIGPHAFSFPLGAAIEYFMESKTTDTEELKDALKNFSTGYMGPMMEKWLESMLSTKSAKWVEESDTEETKAEASEEKLDQDTTTSTQTS